MTTELITFGKYRGQPVDVLQQDPMYCEWLMGQAWLKSRFPDLRTLIINNFAAPSETPEHNKLQARFLDDAFLLAAVRLLATDCDVKPFPRAGRACIRLTFEPPGADVLFEFGGKTLLKRKEYETLFSLWAEPRSKEAKEKLDSAQRLLDYYSLDPFKGSNLRATEQKEKIAQTQETLTELQQAVEFPHYIHARPIIFELKPAMGDDYPAVLRQITAVRYSGRKVVLIGTYAGTGATFEQVRAMFSASGVTLVTVAEIDGSSA